ncbi:SRPBCC domain-containing protein [Haloflavibacter putidus]|nr:SRPBCC domain-containing protein [Haloflavibacter putidus]
MNKIYMKLESNASIQIQKPIEEVFEAIVNPAKMTNYFISESSGRLEPGKEVVWKFPEFDDRFPITEIMIETDRSISFVWDPETVVKITLEKLPDYSTLVKVNEKEKELNENNLKWALENSGGWANFLACLKAYLEYDINLRKGAFKFMIKK